VSRQWEKGREFKERVENSFRIEENKKEEVMAKSPQTELPHKAFGWAARDTSGVLSPFHFSRRLFIIIIF